jgi:hypothetical protein
MFILSPFLHIYIYLYISSNSICDTEYESVLWEWALSDKSGCFQGRIQDFKLGGVHLKKLRHVEGDAKIFGVFRVKNHDFMPKNHIFSNFRGGAPPSGSAPGFIFHQVPDIWQCIMHGSQIMFLSQLKFTLSNSWNLSCKFHVIR